MNFVVKIVFVDEKFVLAEGAAECERNRRVEESSRALRFFRGSDTRERTQERVVADPACITWLLLEGLDEAIQRPHDPRLRPMANQTDMMISGLQLLEGPCQ